MTLTETDIDMLAQLFSGIAYPAGTYPTGDWLASEVIATAEVRNAGMATIIAMYDSGQIAKTPEDDADLARMADEHYVLNDLAERLRPLSDAEAMAAWVKMRERLESWS